MVSNQLKRAILAELGLDEFELHAGTVAGEVPGWDSLNHVRILNAVERQFDVRFRSLEVLHLRNVGDIQALVDRKLER
jgi:acyl carrier protein